MPPRREEREPELLLLRPDRDVDADGVLRRELLEADELRTGVVERDGRAAGADRVALDEGLAALDCLVVRAS